LAPRWAPPLTRALASGLSAVRPKLPLQPLDPSTVCGDVGVVSAYTRDPLTYTGGMRIRVGAEILRAVAAARAFAHELALPVLIQHGADDVLCNPAGSRAYMDLLTATRDKTLTEYAGLRHEIFNEPSHPTVLADTVAWLRAHVA